MKVNNMSDLFDVKIYRILYWAMPDQLEKVLAESVMDEDRVRWLLFRIRQSSEDHNTWLRSIYVDGVPKQLLEQGIDDMNDPSIRRLKESMG